MDHHILQTLLQLHLASDSQAVIHAPFILRNLTPDALYPSPHLTKWLSRIQTLMQSKDPGVAWTGLTIALKTGLLSNSILIQSANSWISVALPLVARNESSYPTLKAAIRLLRTIFSKGIVVPEFHRQVCLPNVQKLGEILVSVVQKTPSLQFKIFCLDTITHLIALYPTHFRQSQATLSSFCLSLLYGGKPLSTNSYLANSASRCSSMLHLTVGKVASTTAWRKSADDTLAVSWTTYRALRSTFLVDASSNADPVYDVPLQLNRLRAVVNTFNDLFTSTSHRPVEIPIGALSHLASTLLTCSSSPKDAPPAWNVSRRNLEVSCVSSIRKIGCQLANMLCNHFGTHMTPFASKLLPPLLIHLEAKPTASLKVAYLLTVYNLLSKTHSISSEVHLNQIVQAILPTLASLLPTRNDGASGNSQDIPTDASRKGKKRTRMYEGAELLRMDQPSVSHSPDDCKAILLSLQVLDLVLRVPQLDPGLQSLSARVLLSLLLGLRRVPAQSLSKDSTFQRDVSERVASICVGFSHNSSSVLSQVLPLLLKQLEGENATVIANALEVMIHPRLPPLVKNIPQLENLSLDDGAPVDQELPSDSFHKLTPVQAREAGLETSNHDGDQDVEMENPTRLVPDPIPLGSEHESQRTVPVPVLPALSVEGPSSTATMEELPDVGRESSAATETAAWVEPAPSNARDTEMVPIDKSIALPAGNDDDDEGSIPAIDVDSDSD